MTDVDVVAIIPDRVAPIGREPAGQSPSLAPLRGHPLIAHSIVHAGNAQSVDLVIVVTGDRAVATVAERYGATVVAPPDEGGSPAPGVDEVLIDALERLERRGVSPETVVYLRPSAPMRPPGLIDEAVRLATAGTHDSILSATECHPLPSSRDASGASVVGLDRPSDQPGRDGQQRWQENGSVHVTSVAGLRREGSRLWGRVGVVPMHVLDSFRVEREGDLEMVDGLYGVRAGGLDTPDHRTQGLLAPVELLVLDFDGVMTDNSVVVDEHGTEAVACSRSDGWGIARLKDAGVEVVILSTETNPVVAARAAKLGIEAITAVEDKGSALAELTRSRGLERTQVAFMGNDVNDLPGFARAGVCIAVADAAAPVLVVVDLVTERNGGTGAVREIADQIISARTARGDGLDRRA